MHAVRESLERVCIIHIAIDLIDHPRSKAIQTRGLSSQTMCNPKGIHLHVPKATIAARGIWLSYSYNGEVQEIWVW
jgi:hypothetical protein